MIPELPEGCTNRQQVEFYKSLVARLDSQNEFHVKWYSHKKDPSVCWMCDQQILVYKVLALCEDILQSPPLDIETVQESDSEVESESEIIDIENPTDSDIQQGYNEPEYEIDEDGYRDKVEEL